ncbi:MAG TPA: prephenate dehydrogenase/arogenate dehydrogenase family protein [Gemmatimonadales bacterium]|nr:prephenate dehydrogenase/arogenate dehydrogenase family protein [Gemmatimonadales bacterium]
MRPTTLGVIGLGAIGGSLARLAKQSKVSSVLGWSPDALERRAALEAGALDDAPVEPAAIAKAADLLVLAAPPAANLQLLEILAPHLSPRTLVTDVGSVKRAIVERAERLRLGPRFAGSHPLAGTHGHGFWASRDTLLVNAVVYVTPTNEGAAAAREVAGFWESVCGARTVLIDALAHDRQMAVTSHLPQVIASLLGRYLADHAPAGAPLGPGARDTTRLAASDPPLWTEILLMNRDALLPVLRGLEEPLGELERGLEEGDPIAVEAWLAKGAVWRRGVDG